MRNMITLSITEDDIQYGIPANTHFCPVARAVKRKFNIDRGVVVSISQTEITNPARGKTDIYTHTNELSAFIRDYDGGCECMSGEFRMQYDRSY